MANIEKYEPEKDIFSNRDIKRNWGKMFLDNQTLSKEVAYQYIYPVEKWNLSSCKQLQDGLGAKNPIFWASVLGMTYAGGYLAASRQMINDPMYLTNQAFDLFKGRKFYALGLVSGIVLGSFLVGKPSLVQDYMISKWNRLFTLNREDRGGFSQNYITSYQGIEARSRPDIRTVFDS